jgi:hypothetical protein
MKLGQINRNSLIQKNLMITDTKGFNDQYSLFTSILASTLPYYNTSEKPIQ